MRPRPGQARVPARLISAWARLARPVLGLFRLGLRCPDDPYDGADVFGCRVDAVGSGRSAPARCISPVEIVVLVLVIPGLAGPGDLAVAHRGAGAEAAVTMWAGTAT
jgi:hypothetical protein